MSVAPNRRSAVAPPKPRNPLLQGLALACCLAGIVGVAASPLLVQDAGEKRDLRSEAIAVRAKLLSAEVREWIAGRGNWYPRGDFQIITPGFEGKADADLTPREVAAGRSNRRIVSREEAQQFLVTARVGAETDAYLYPDVRDKLFFALPDAASVFDLAQWLRWGGGALLLLGIATFVFGSQRYDLRPEPVTRRRDEPFIGPDSNNAG